MQHVVAPALSEPGDVRELVHEAGRDHDPATADPTLPSWSATTNRSSSRRMLVALASRTSPP